MDFISVVAIVIVVLMAVVFTAVFVSQRAKYKSLEFESKKKQEQTEDDKIARKMAQILRRKDNKNKRKKEKEDKNFLAKKLS